MCVGINFYDMLVIVQGGGIFTLDHPRMCSHTREVEFDSQHAPSNATFDHRIVGGLVTLVIVLLRSAPYPYSPSSSVGWHSKDLSSSRTTPACRFPMPS